MITLSKKTTGVDDLVFNFFERPHDECPIFIESPASARNAFLVLQHERTNGSVVPIVEGVIPLIKTRECNKLTFKVPVMIDNETDEFVVMSPERYKYRREEGIETILVKLKWDRKDQLMGWTRHKCFKEDERYEMIVQ